MQNSLARREYLRPRRYHRGDMASRLPDIEGVTRVTTSAFVNASKAPENQYAAPCLIEPDVAIRLFTSARRENRRSHCYVNRPFGRLCHQRGRFASAAADKENGKT